MTPVPFRIHWYSVHRWSDVTYLWSQWDRHFVGQHVVLCIVKLWRFDVLFEWNWISWFKKMSVLSLSQWENDVYWRQTFPRAFPTKWRKTGDIKKLRHCHPIYRFSGLSALIFLQQSIVQSLRVRLLITAKIALISYVAWIVTETIVLGLLENNLFNCNVTDCNIKLLLGLNSENLPTKQKNNCLSNATGTAHWRKVYL